jgi:flavin reductase (DIM6/NTAB) family NADH-FMN oxidoreductase RutF
VHLIAADQRDLAELFGGETGDEVDKLAACPWHEGPEGVPILDDVSHLFVGRVLDRIDLGDHIGHLLEPVAGRSEGQTSELGFQEARGIEAGHPA